MSNSQQHLNGDQIVAIDVETTGLEVGYHEICQLAMVPVDNFYKPRKDVMPLNFFIRPEYPANIDPQALKVSRIKRQSLIDFGIDSEKAKDLLEDWVDKLELPYNSHGTRKCRIVPLGHNFSFDASFLMHWLGKDIYEELFSYQIRDTMTTALFINDKASMYAKRVPFPKHSLVYIAAQLKIPYANAHNALEDCKVTAEVYHRMMLEQGSLNL